MKGNIELNHCTVQLHIHMDAQALKRLLELLSLLRAAGQEDVSHA